MAIITFFLFIWLVCKGLKALFQRHDRVEYEQPETETENKVINNLAALDALQKQRAIYNDLLSDIDCRLDNAPATREKLLKDKAMIYSKLAIVENKISKLMN